MGLIEIQKGNLYYFYGSFARVQKRPAVKDKERLRQTREEVKREVHKKCQSQKFKRVISRI